MANVWHYHHACGNKFQLKSPRESGDACPKCDQPFIRRSENNCNGCHTVFYSDRIYNEGDEFNCPINGEPVRVESSRLVKARDRSKYWWVRLAIIFIGGAAILYVIFIFVLAPLVSWIIAAIETIVAAILAVIPVIIAAAVELLKILALTVASVALIVVGVRILALINKMLHILAAKPADSFNVIYVAGDRRNQTAYLKWKLRLEPDLPDGEVWRKTLTKGRGIVLTQQMTINLLIIGMVTGGLVCYLSKQPLEEAGGVTTQRIPQLGIGIFGIALIFYGFKYFLRFRGRLAPLTQLLKGLAFSSMLAAATVITVVLVPLLGQSSLSVSEIVIGLALNIVVDLLISSYGVIADLFWGTSEETSNISIKGAWQRLRG